MEKFWMGNAPTCCDMCKKPFDDIFIDGKSTAGPWAFFCESHHRFYGVGLGTGRGQKYKKQADGRWLKVEG